jgi:dUTP pyrophosphatase
MAVMPIVDELEVRLLHPGAAVPARSRSGDAGFDLRCVEPFVLRPGERALIPTGLAVAIPPGVAGLVLPRSGLAHRFGVTCANAPGLVDPNYRGELKVVLVNLGREIYRGHASDRIAQLLLVPFWAPELRVVDELPASERGEAGFGSSGR